MSSREDRVSAFLDVAGWREAWRTTVAGDLSARRYERLTAADGVTAILMDAPPDRDSTTPAFVRLTSWLRDAGLSAPEILAQDADAGLLLLEDFGDDKISDVVAAGSSQRDAVYDLCLDLLLSIRRLPTPDLVRPDARKLVRMTELADAHYPGADGARLAGLRSLLEAVFASLLQEEASLSLRDFHADNLMWLPRRTGVRRLGLLDYQDAFLTHPVYDLVSLLTDARTEIDASFRERMMSRYCEKSGDGAAGLGLAFAAFSLQRNLRILGIFARAAREFGKTTHLAKLPRVHAYFTEALTHPTFLSVRDETLAAVPFPTRDLIETMS